MNSAVVPVKVNTPIRFELRPGRVVPPAYTAYSAGAFLSGSPGSILLNTGSPAVAAGSPEPTPAPVEGFVERLRARMDLQKQRIEQIRRARAEDPNIYPLW